MESQLPQGSAGFAVGDVVESGLSDQAQTEQQITGGDLPSESTDTTISDATVQNTAASPSESGEGAKPQVPSSAAAAAKASRKRTKTGCLTCRKRRIKCGEERPTCANCIKSKRVCEGYTQRVVFKAGINGSNGMYRPAIVPAGGRAVHPYPIQPAPIAPAPAVGYPLQQQPRGFYEEREGQGIFQSHGQSPIAPLSGGLEQNQYQQHQDPYAEHHHQVPVNQLDRGGQLPQYYSQVPGSATAFSGSPTGGGAMFVEPVATPVFGPGQIVGQYGGGPESVPFVPSHPPASSVPSTCSFNPPIDTRYAIASASGQMAQPGPEFSKVVKSNDTLTPSGPSGPPLRPANAPAVDPSFGGAHFVGPESIQLLQAGDIEYDEDDDEFEEEEGDEDDDDDDDEDYEVRDWDEMIVDPRTGEEMISPRTHISNVIGPYSKNFENSRISFRSFLPDQDALTAYHPTMTSSPLMNQMTAKIFCHFIYVLGPSLSLFERYPPNPHIAFTPGAGLNGPQNVWSYTIPMLSLSHPPLLHAVLALSSLHISKLTRGPMHPSLLHYHIALRRLGKAIASDKHRCHVATLAATLLLGYYETMAAEHDKWSSHIHGAKQLLKEIDFDRLIRRAEMMEEERLTGESSYQPTAPPSLLRLRKMRRQSAVSEVDENLTAYMMGKAKRKPNLALRRTAATQFSRKEIETMQLQEDMFWWFAKMDCYQSVLSGCPLVLDYVYWSQCPPRARIGTLGTMYGSSDHFYLLLGRLCDFQVRDLKRKKAMQKANGGMWIPPPEMGGPPRGRGRGRGGPPPQGAGGPSSMQGPPIGPGPPSGGPPPLPGGPYGAPTWGMQGPSGKGGPPGMGSPPEGPPFEQMQFGMIPNPGPPRLPSAFASLPTAPQESEPQAYEDLEAATALAEAEWEDIKEAFAVFQESLGHEYQPLPIEYMTVENTPFGAAIYYRTYSIATLQSLYNMALIILHRCHPSMPAVSMVAAGVAASKTAGYAIDIARITAGLVPTDPNGQINPALGASLIESSMPIFFAAVQYQDQAQRNWVVTKLREIARLTGWATASRVLLGCQRAWEKAAEMGRGPRYTRPPFEEEGELFYEAFNQQMAADTGVNAGINKGDTDAPPGSKRFLWRTAGRRTAGAIGILGEDGEDLGIGGLNLSV